MELAIEMARGKLDLIALYCSNDRMNAIIVHEMERLTRDAEAVVGSWPEGWGWGIPRGIDKKCPMS